MADIHPVQAIWDDEIQPQMRYRMRLWVLNGAAGISDNFPMHAAEGSLAPARSPSTASSGRGRRRSL
jgi:hypothetical protein